MNDLNIDFSDPHQVLKVRQRFFTYLGIGICIMSILPYAFDKATLRQIISSSCLFISGIAAIIQANPLIFKWARGYINISKTDIEYKFWGIQPKTHIKWDYVSSLTLEFNEIYFILKNNKSIKLDLSFLSDTTLSKIKQCVLRFGNEKGIKTLEMDN